MFLNRMSNSTPKYMDYSEARAAILYLRLAQTSDISAKNHPEIVSRKQKIKTSTDLDKSEALAAILDSRLVQQSLHRPRTKQIQFREGSYQSVSIAHKIPVDMFLPIGGHNGKHTNLRKKVCFRTNMISIFPLISMCESITMLNLQNHKNERIYRDDGTTKHTLIYGGYKQRKTHPVQLGIVIFLRLTGCFDIVNLAYRMLSQSLM